MTETSDNVDWLSCEGTRSALARLDRVLREAVTAEDLQLRIMALHIVERRGKRLRPALLFLAATFGDFSRPGLMTCAAALELLHVASLYHDDVMDRAPLRRSGASTNARWGNEAATFAGTYLFARASSLLASLGDEVGKLAANASVELCTGQLQEVENAYNLELSETEHLQILTRKTATLFELPCRLGALLGGASSEDAEALAGYGSALGLAFQLADDALDLTAQARQIGKATGTDLREGVYSLPVLRTLSRQDAVGEQVRYLLEKARLAEDDRRTVLSLVLESGTVEESLELARRYVERALAALDGLPDGPPRSSLARLADYAIARSL